MASPIAQAAVFVVVGGSALIALVYLTGVSCISDMCGNDLKDSISSPDGKRKAVEFVRDCGATMGFSTQISVIPSGETLRNVDSGNTFVQDSGARIDLEWKDDQTLILHGGKTVFRSESHVAVPNGWFRSRTVNVEYRP